MLAVIREAVNADFAEIRGVINDGASAYRGVIPDDRWHEPYMSEAELQSEIRAGVEFSCSIDGGQIVAVMGIQDMGPVVLVRHAYVRTFARRRGLGAELLAALTRKVKKPILIGEMASSETGGNKAAWINAIIPALQQDFPLIKAVIWFDVNKERDWRISSSSATESAFRTLAADPFFNP